MANSPNKFTEALGLSKTWSQFLATAVGDGTIADLISTAKVDQNPGTVSRVPFGQVNKELLNLIDDALEYVYAYGSAPSLWQSVSGITRLVTPQPVVIGNAGSTVGAAWGTVTGDDCDAAAEYAHAHGEDAIGQRMYGYAMANGSFAAAGDRMTTVFEVSRYTPDATTLELTMDGGTPVNGTGPEDSNRIRLEDDKSYMIEVALSARGDQSGLGTNAALVYHVHASATGGAATVDSSNVAFASLSNYNVSITASGAFILVKGAGSNEPTRSHARITMTEVEGPAPP
jgi:hypothetical protein